MEKFSRVNYNTIQGVGPTVSKKKHSNLLYFSPTHPCLCRLPSSPIQTFLFSFSVAPSQAVDTLVRRVSFRKERSVFQPQPDRGSPITPETSTILPADMKQMSS